MTNKSKTPRAKAAREKRLERFATMIAADLLEVPEDETELVDHADSEYDFAKAWAAAGWDVNVTVQETKPAWDCSDSGYSSDASSSTVHLPPPSPEEIKYDQLSFKKKHDLHTYVVRTLEAACFNYGRTRLAKLLGDFEWKRLHLQFRDSQYPDDRLVYKDWLKEDQIELKSWALMFERLILSVPDHGAELKVPGAGAMLNCAIMLRNATIHRGELQEGDELTYQLYCNATRLPGELLRDSQAASEIQDAFAYVTEDPKLDSDARARVEAAMYAPRPCTTDRQLLVRIQTLLEESCFNYASRKIPHVLATKGWQIPEQVELPEWCRVYDDARLQHDVSADNIFPDMGEYELRNLVHDARTGIRNPAAHFQSVLIDKLVMAIHGAIRLCILQADWRQAIEIEVLAETYFTGCSRAQILDRLESAYRDGPVETAYEHGRRAAICQVLENEGRRQGGHDLETLEALRGGDPEMRWVEQTWSPSMHGCLKRAKEEIGL